MRPQSIAYVCPGQGSQYVGMGKDLYEQFPFVRTLFQKANNVLGYDLMKIMWDDPDEEINKTEFTQPALFLHSFAAFLVFRENFSMEKPIFLAGHSLGEISAMAISGAISFEDGLQLVSKRGDVMSAAGKSNPGGMAAVIGMDLLTLDRICQSESNADEIVQIANDNCPGQIVISGHLSALDKATTLAMEHGARKVRRLSVSIAAHSALMASTVEPLSDHIKNTMSFQSIIAPVISNVFAKPMDTEDDFKKDILLQLTSRVRWTETIQYLENSGINTIIEMGSGNVLSGLVKRITDKINCFSMGNLKDLDNYKHAMDVNPPL